MTLVIDTLAGSFEYPVRTIGFLIKKKWDNTNTGGVTPVFLIPDSTEITTGDPWTSGVPPEIVFRKSGGEDFTRIDIGDSLVRESYGVAIHVFSASQQQEFLFTREIKRILKEFGRDPILKYSTDYDTPPTTALDSGLKTIRPHNPRFTSEDDENIQTDYMTHSVGTVNAIWFEHRT